MYLILGSNLVANVQQSARINFKPGRLSLCPTDFFVKMPFDGKSVACGLDVPDWLAICLHEADYFSGKYLGGGAKN